MIDEYDLLGVAGSDRVARVLRYAFGIALLVPLGALAWYAVTLPTTWWTESGSIVITALVLFFASILVLAFLGFGPGANSVVFDQAGFALYFGRGRAKRYDWANPRLRITVSELVGDGRVEYGLSSSIPFNTSLSSAAFTRLLEEARIRKLSVQLTQSSVPSVSRGPGTKVVTYRISHMR